MTQRGSSYSPWKPWALLAALAVVWGCIGGVVGTATDSAGAVFGFALVGALLGFLVGRWALARWG